MRVAAVLAVMMLAGCAGEKLSVVPPPGVDFSGRWTLNEADSDDPQRLIQSQIAAPATGAAGSGGQPGRGGRRGGGGGAGPGGGFGGGGPGAPLMPAMGALGEGLRWPGKDLEVKQNAGVVTFYSVGRNLAYRPTALNKNSRRSPKSRDDNDPSHGRAGPAHGRGDGAPPICGWDDKTLVVESGDPDEDHPPFEERYSLSADRQRLIEVVGFKGGRSAGFTMSRVWDRAATSAP